MTKILQKKKKYFQSDIEVRTARTIPKIIHVVALMKMIIIPEVEVDDVAVLMNTAITKECNVMASTGVAQMKVIIITREVTDDTACTQMTVPMTEIIPVQMKTVRMKEDADMIPEVLNLTCIVDAQVAVKEILTATGAVIEGNRGLVVKIA